MALDTREKRAGVIGVGRPWLRTKEPSSDKDQQWRMASGLTYGGNALTPAAGPTLTYTFTVEIQRDHLFETTIERARRFDTDIERVRQFEVSIERD